MEKFFSCFVIALLITATAIFQLDLKTAVAKEETPSPSPATQELAADQPIITQSEFETEIITEKKTLERSIVHTDDPEMEAGEEKITEEGSDGYIKKIWKITSIGGEEFEREELKSEKVLPVAQQVSKGTKIVWRTMDTPDGEIRYWRKLRVYATHYDQFCNGCDQWTAIGMRAGKGVIAVDPKVIKLRSKVYVPGYGPAVAGDTGGAIKGNIIDLGFEDAKTAGWSARYVDIYLL